MTEPVVTYADDYESHPPVTYGTVPIVQTKVVTSKVDDPEPEATKEAETK